MPRAVRFFDWPAMISAGLPRYMWLNHINYRAARRLCAWFVLCLALFTYLLTIEPTASYWDCPEYVAVAVGLQPGHPPGNPLWMLVARFFINFAPAPEYRALAVNVMSAVCGALTVMLLFLTIEIFARRLLRPVSRHTSIVCLGSAMVGALAFCWSDSFWFSAVEAEVYAFSSLCTALLFWLALVYYEKRHEPHSDRYLILLAYLTGLTIGVHELNLLCIPALMLVVAYGLRRRLHWWQVLFTLLAGLAGIALVLYGIIPGFIALAQRVELLCVNTWGWSFNSGLLLTWVVVTVLLAGGAVWASAIQYSRHPRLLRVLRVGLWSVFMVLLGFSCYALIIIRSAAGPPLDTGHPADIFAFDNYFSREQYGKAPLLYGAPFTAQPMRLLEIENGDTILSRYALRHIGSNYVQGVVGMPPHVAGVYATPEQTERNRSLQARGGDFYHLSSHNYEREYPPELNMWFPRMHSHGESDITGYLNWIDADYEDMYEPDHITLAVDSAGNPVRLPYGSSSVDSRQVRPTYWQNTKYFLLYQCVYMYWRYFMWNYVGRQNDYYGHGEPDAGNFITGVDALDCLMLDVAAEAPANAGRGNKARNVYFALPLILGIAGLIYQVRCGSRGRRQALLITTLFVLTGIAIVVYLNQGPVQARDRDYAFLGSWYAFSIWLGLGTLAVYSILRRIIKHRPRLTAYLSVGLSMCVPLQTLSQTYDDHDRSGRTVTRDMAHNMLSSVGEQAIIIASQDNNIFPLWYMTEAEEYRTDVRIISAPYMSMGWYPDQWLRPMRKSRPVEMTAPRGLLVSDALSFISLGRDTTWTPAVEALKTLYTEGMKSFMANPRHNYPELKTPRVFMVYGSDTVRLDLARDMNGFRVNTLYRDELLTLDILATNAASPRPRPIYWTRSVGESLFKGALKPYLERVGTLLHFNPAAPGINARATGRIALSIYRYGTQPGCLTTGRLPYFDPVASDKLDELRSALIESARMLSATGSADDARMAVQLLTKVENEMPEALVPYYAIELEPEVYGVRRVPRYADPGLMAAEAYEAAGHTLADSTLIVKGRDLREHRMEALQEIDRYCMSMREGYRKFLTYRLSNLLKVLHPIPAPDTTKTLLP